jgi:N-succinyldiaminopimelate aminotransferase
MNPGFEPLHPYPFEKLNKLNAGIEPDKNYAPILLSIGEPKHATPQFILDAVCSAVRGFANYPTIVGSLELRDAISNWLIRRFKLPSDSLKPDKHVLPVNGTREALFAIAQCLIDPAQKPFVVMPNPFYQIYEGAALLAGAKPYYLNTTDRTSFMLDFDSVDASVWKKCQLIYLCSPGNPTGAVLSKSLLQRLIELSNKYDFVICSDECYSEIYPDEANPPTGLLQAAAAAGDDSFKNCLVFHSLSKRSNVPGMRSGFVAGDARLIERFRLYRTYHGCSMPPPIQSATIAAWQDEKHVIENRALYRRKFDRVLEILTPVINVTRPNGAFYLWPETPISDTEFARELYRRFNVTVLPGSYLSRENNGENPGANRLRIAVVASEAECVDAAQRIKACAQELKATSKSAAPV